MSLQFMYDIGLKIISFCQDVISVMTMTMSEVLSAFSFWDTGPLFTRGWGYWLTLITNALGLSNSTLVEVLLFGSVGFFVVWTLVKWILDIIF